MECGNGVWGSCVLGLVILTEVELLKQTWGPGLITPVNSQRTSKAVSLEIHTFPPPGGQRLLNPPSYAAEIHCLLSVD